MSASVRIPDEVSRAWRELEGECRVEPLAGGLLHSTLRVRTSTGTWVLQRVSDVFSSAIEDNIRSVTAHLRARGLVAPVLLPSRRGAVGVDAGPHGRWRLMEDLGGVCFERLASLEQARSAGRLVGRFHGALRDFDGELAPMGIPYRDTPAYLKALRHALATRKDHRLAARVRPLGEAVLAAFESLGPPAEGLPQRVIHGDLKLANVLFEGPQPPARDRAFALIDLDTLMRGPLWMELGDVWRSWCNPSGEETAGAGFDLAAFEASWRGFVEGHAEPLETAELESLETAAERITLEVCARFVTDALEECYFGWNPERHPARGEHNAERAERQWALYEAEREQLEARRAVLHASK